MDVLFALLHAPGLGPASWEPVAERLAAAGHRVAVPALAGFADSGPPYARHLVDSAVRQVRPGPLDRVILVVHSAAGVFAPYLAEEIPAAEIAVIFADATVPPQRPGGRVVSTGSFPFLRGLARDGMVPPWPKWWPEEVLRPLFPDEASYRAVTSQASPLPLGFFEEPLPPVPGSWPACRPGYLRFSEPYADQADEAARRGWLVRDLPGGHLHMLVSPAEVAAAITALAAEQSGSPAGQDH